MDYKFLSHDISYLGSSGVMLSNELKSILATSLTLLQDDEKLDNIQFWGKIKGMNGNYFIVKGFGSDYFSPKRFFYSKDCITWGLLTPTSTEIDLAASKLQEHPFSGDPSFILTASVTVGTNTENGNTEEMELSVKEEDRLMHTVNHIDTDTHIVPRRALIMNHDSTVVPNRLFEGLSLQEASFPYNFLYLNKIIEGVKASMEHKERLSRADYDIAIDFMISLQDDVPAKSWTLQVEEGLVVLKSLKWLGVVFYHLIGTNHYGSCYFGDGRINKDLAFMI